MRSILFTLLGVAAFVPVLGASSVGSGAPNPNAQAGFVNAYFRGSFQTLTLPPTADVTSFGPTGLIQQFPSVSNKALTFALVKPDANAPVTSNDTLQVFSDIFSLYSNAGVGNAGYPTMDTAQCPTNSYGICDYQLFTKNYAFFAYSSPAGANYTVKDPLYTEWNNQGGIAGTLNVATDSERSVTSPSKLAGSQQLFLNGAIYTYSTTTTTGTVASTYSVYGTTFGAYVTGGGFPALGFPTSAEVVLATGLHRQTFELARVEWSASASPQLLFPLSEIDIQGAAQGLTMQVGDVITLNASSFDSNGTQVTGRSLSWTTTNGQAISVQGNGYSAVIKAIGKGAANVTVTGEGKSSAPIQIRVGSVCCDIGDGAPTPAIQSAFQSAVSRNHLMLALPNATPVVRTVGGYTQEFLASTSGGGSTVICESDKSTVAFVMAGAVYAAFLKNGGFPGTLGYPSSDLSAGGTQLFESGWALAGTPVRAVPPAIRAKWGQLGFESGAFGAPTSDPLPYTTVSNTSGVMQGFVSGSIYASGTQVAFGSTGPILTRYNALSGPSGVLGAPTSDVSSSGGVARQNFENGYIDLQPGTAAAVEHLNPRQPLITITPARVVPGGKVHIALAGFASKASLKVTQTNQADFQVSVPLGLYSWDMVLPSNAALGTFTVLARDAATGDNATASYTVTGIPQLAPSLTAVSGDGQTGAPGSLLPLPLIAALKDLSGNPIAGVPVFASASPGATVQAASVTDANGLVSAVVRMPLSGVAIVSLTAGGKVVSFSARAAGYSIAGFPALSQQDSATLVGNGTRNLLQKGSMVTALAGLIRFYQNQARLGSPNGLATPQLLNQYLTSTQGYSSTDTGDQIVNPWAAMAFTGFRGGIIVEPAMASRLLDLVGSGTPVLIGFVLQIDGAAGGTTFMVVTGIADDGSVQVADSAFGRTSMNDYLAGFSAGGHRITGTFSSMLQVTPAISTPAGFVVSSAARPAEMVASIAGGCTAILDVFDIQAPGLGAQSPNGAVRFVACDGTQSAYQASFAAASRAQVFDFSTGSTQAIQTASATAFAVSRGPSGLTFTPQKLALTAVVNSASFTPQVATGGLATLFGTGLTAGATDSPIVKVGGLQAYLSASFPFQLNIQIPESVPAGATTVTVTGALGTASQNLTVVANAPGIFAIGTAANGQLLAAAVNQNGTVNGPSNPAGRGEYLSIYCTGLGAKVAQNGYQVAPIPLNVVLGEIEAVPSYAGAAPGLIGVDQINVQIPSALPPSLSTPLLIRQAGKDSAIVIVSVQ